MKAAKKLNLYLLSVYPSYESCQVSHPDPNSRTTDNTEAEKKKLIVFLEPNDCL